MRSAQHFEKAQHRTEIGPKKQPECCEIALDFRCIRRLSLDLSAGFELSDVNC